MNIILHRTSNLLYKPFIPIFLQKRYMETETLRISNAVVDYNIKKESNYMVESEEIMKYIYDSIRDEKDFSEIASDSVPRLGYLIDPRSFAYSLEYLREQVSKQGVAQAEMFNNLIETKDDIGIYKINEDNIVLDPNYKNIYNDYVNSISYDTVSKVSAEGTTDITNNTTSEMSMEPIVNIQQEVNVDILNYIIRSINTETPISCIIKESVNLGYNMSSKDFFNAMETLIKDDAELMANYLRKFDDKDLYMILSDNEICKYKSSDKEYYEILEETASNSDSSTVDAASESNSNTESEEERYSVPVDSDSSSNASNSGISFEHDLNLNDNKTILILTLMSFLTIRAIAWYVSTYHKDSLINNDDSDETEKTQLNSVFENFYYINHITTKMLLCLIPFCVLIIYNLRYYYFYRYLYRVYNENKQRFN